MKVLIVLTSHDKLGDTGEKTGFWLEEFAAPYYALRDTGAELTLASPAGGQPPVDPRSDAPEAQTDAMTRFHQDPDAQEQLARSPMSRPATSMPCSTQVGMGRYGTCSIIRSPSRWSRHSPATASRSPRYATARPR